MRFLLPLAIVGCTLSTNPPGLPDESNPDAAAPNQITSATIDPNVKLSEPPGTGVGVFVEYATGGHWHLWWTCDTNISGLPCTFEVSATVASGAVTNVAGDRLETDDTLSSNTTEVTLSTSTTTGVDGVWFDTSPGTSISVLGKVGSAQYGTFFFWSQSGVIEGGGTPAHVADPLTFVPASP